MSSSEAENYGLTSAAMKAAHLTQLCSELGIYSDEPFLIYEDNKAAIKMAARTPVIPNVLFIWTVVLISFASK